MVIYGILTKEASMQKRLSVCGHSGFPSKYPENTLAAFEKSSGGDGVASTPDEMIRILKERGLR